jgi:hypothetical protein
MAYFHANRRLFASYEPFFAARVVKVSAACPISWKLNRRLFHKAVQPLFLSTKWVLHTKGRLPYFSSWNVFAQSAGHLRFTVERRSRQNRCEGKTLRNEFETDAAWAERRQMVADLLGGQQMDVRKAMKRDALHLAIRSKLRLTQIVPMLHHDFGSP